MVLNSQIASCSIENCIGVEHINGKVIPTTKIKVYKFSKKETNKIINMNKNKSANKLFLIQDIS